MATFEVTNGIKGGQTWGGGSVTRFGSLGAGMHSPAQDTEARDQVLVRSSYTLGNMYVRVMTNTSTGSYDFRSRINAANGALLVTILTLETGAFQDTVNTDSPVAGDLVNYSVLHPAVGSILTSIVGFTMVNATGNNTVLVANTIDSAGVAQASTLTRYQLIGGGIEINITTEANAQYTVRSSATLSNLRVFVIANTSPGTSVVRTRVNVADGAQSVSILTTQTGSFEDTTNSDSVVAGDEINYQMVTPAGGGSLTWFAFQLKSAGTGRQVALGGDAVLSADRFEPAEGALQAGAADAEALHQIGARSTFTASNLFVNVRAHGASSGVDFTLRVGGVSSALTLNVADSTTGLFENTTNTVNLVSGNLYNTLVDHGGGAGSITFTLIGFQNGPTSGGGGYPSQMLNKKPRRAGRVTQGLRVP